ncbi:uncharacterized protein V6R79_010696 [Siganus canaliculatus]
MTIDSQTPKETLKQVLVWFHLLSPPPSAPTSEWWKCPLLPPCLLHVWANGRAAEVKSEQFYRPVHLWSSRSGTVHLSSWCEKGPPGSGLWSGSSTGLCNGQLDQTCQIVPVKGSSERRFCLLVPLPSILLALIQLLPHRAGVGRKLVTADSSESSVVRLDAVSNICVVGGHVWNPVVSQLL